MQETADVRSRLPVIYYHYLAYKRGGLQMLSLQTVLPDTLELLKKLMCQPLLGEMRLVGGTSLIDETKKLQQWIKDKF